MRHCAFCATELPEQAQFCGYCGRLCALSGERSHNRAVSSPIWSSQDGPTVISNTALPTMINEQTVIHPQQEERTLLTPFNNAVWTPPVPQRSSEEEEQDRMRRAMVWGIPLAGTEAQGPSGAPGVQGTPQVNSAPSLSGTPQLQRATYQKTQFAHQGKRAQTRGVSSAGARAAKGAVTQWVIVVVTAVIVLTTAGVGVALAMSPSLSFSGGLSGDHTVVPGQHLSLHGSGFLPGGHVTLKRDNGQLVQIAAQNRPDEKVASANMTALFAFSRATADGDSVNVNAAGAFDASVLVGNDWSGGIHTIRATEDMFSRSATMTVTVGDAPPELSVSPTTLDFGLVQKGTKTTLALAIGNTGGKPLAWTAGSDGTKWLKLQATSGGVLPGGVPQSLAISCDTTSLALGTYSSILHIQTDGGSADVKVSVQVVAQKQAKLAVSTAALDFQTMDQSQQASKVVSISNTGTLKLDWQVTGDEDWVSLTPTSGSIQSGGADQGVNVQVDTTGMQPGNYAATLTVGSNGGAIQVTVSLVIPASLPATPTPTPTQVLPTPTPTLMPTATPTATATPQGRICKLPSALDFGIVSQGQTAMQPVTLGNCGGASFTWQAQPGATWVTVDNPGSTLDPSTTTTINVTVDTTLFSAPGIYYSKVIFYTSVGNQTVNITVTMPQPTPTPTA
ncbi:MAG TPA: choice-of-anchor D domain-containing protein, partial [Ktedonobacteraceae bacterium]